MKSGELRNHCNAFIRFSGIVVLEMAVNCGTGFAWGRPFGLLALRYLFLAPSAKAHMNRR